MLITPEQADAYKIELDHEQALKWNKYLDDTLPLWIKSLNKQIAHKIYKKQSCVIDLFDYWGKSPDKLDIAEDVVYNMLINTIKEHGWFVKFVRAEYFKYLILISRVEFTPKENFWCKLAGLFRL